MATIVLVPVLVSEGYLRCGVVRDIPIGDVP